MDLLTRLLAAHAETPEDQRGDALRAILTEAGDLPGLRDAVISRFEELHGAEDGPDEDALTEMEALADIAEATSQQITDNAAREAALEERRTGAADRLARARQASEPATPADTGQGQGDGGGAENDDAETGAGQDDTGQGRP
ncbi:MAG: hypothetical protein J2P26_04840, partial [Nocardiopsaceae bacterium]|nr:hypothetical protein [Nocardiopsaceae bacterium]